MNILFRTDSSSTIGTGHIMRDLVLAKQYKGATITFAVQELQGNINHKIIEAGHSINILNSRDIEELDALIKKLNIDLLIIDHYEIDYTYEKQLKTQNPQLKILSFDDTYKKHYCNILLNHNIYADASKYRDLVPTWCELRCGEEFTLLRDEFYEAKKNILKLKTQNSKLNIFIAMGGTDIANLNPKIIEILEDFNNIHVDMVTTKANNKLKELQLYIKDKPWVSLHVNATNIAELMAKSNLAIITPSVTMNEVWYMEIPFIAIKVADNQRYMYKYLIECQYNVYENFDSGMLSAQIIKIQKGLV